MAPVLFDQFTREVQAEFRAADTPGLGILCPHEAPEDLRLLARWYANAAILNCPGYFVDPF
jgi:hypothetical protein